MEIKHRELEFHFAFTGLIYGVLLELPELNKNQERYSLHE